MISKKIMMTLTPFSIVDIFVANEKSDFKIDDVTKQKLILKRSTSLRNANSWLTKAVAELSAC